MGLWRAFTRRKSLHSINPEESQLGQVLTTFDLTALGVGSTLGVGIYVLAGVVSKEIAGPAVVLSFFFAAVASVFAGLCYAEFGARVPKSGSAYLYSYITIGEFVAFVIGWDLIIEYIIGGASVAKGLSLYVDSLTNNSMERFYRSMFVIDFPYLSEYVDLFALAICLILCFGLAVGVKESMLLNNILTTVNVGIVLAVIVIGSFKADIKNWQLPKESIPETAGEGGFFPFGIMGAIRGAATCFYGYVGFDCIATSGEEVRNPQRAIPVSIILSLAIIFLAYFGVSAVLTLMWPYYLQDVDAPIPYAFSQAGLNIAQWIIAVGSIFGLCTSLFGGMFPLPRIIYSMSQDGLLFKKLGHVHSRFKTPFTGTIISGILTGVMAAAFKLKDLVDLMSMATLVAYTIVAACVLLLRYRKPDESSQPMTHESVEHSHLLTQTPNVTLRHVLPQIFNLRAVQEPTFLTTRIVSVNTVIICTLCIVLGLCLKFWESSLASGSVLPIVMCLALVVLISIVLFSISLQPVSPDELYFKVPFVPVVPALSIFINIYLMLFMDLSTWIHFAVWIAVGLLIYFAYGLTYSVENRMRHNKVDYSSMRSSESVSNSENEIC